MDVNGMPMEGFPSVDLTSGMTVAPMLAASMQVPEVTGGADNVAVTDEFSGSEMEHIILKYKAAQSAKEAEKVLEKNVPDAMMSKVLDNLENDFFS